MEANDMDQNLWSLANLVCGFAVAQGITFALALGRDFRKLQHASITFKIRIAEAGVVFASLYSLAVIVCAVLGSELDRNNPAFLAIWLDVTIGRIIAILAFTALGIGALFAGNYFAETKKHSRK